jgi:hypothetical protein
MSLRHGTAQALDLLYLLIEYLLRLAPHLLLYELVEVHRRHRSPDVHDVHLGACVLGQANRGSGGDLRIPRVIGSQENLGGEDAHELASSL